jgi:hypothetical protein
MRNLMRSVSAAALMVGASLALSGVANATPIDVTFNFVPFGTLTADTGNVLTATTITSGAPLQVTTILVNNIDLVSGQTITITTPTPVTSGATFQKMFSTTIGGLAANFTENLTVSGLTPGPTSLGVAATGMISCSGPGCGTLVSTPVFYSAAYTQNGGPGAQINGSFNDSTTPPSTIPLPAALPLFATGIGGFGFLGWRRKRKAQALAA